MVEVAERLRKALDIERVTKKFYGEFYDEHLAFIELIRGIPDDKQRRWYASVLLNRLMFIYFLQKKRIHRQRRPRITCKTNSRESRCQGPEIAYYSDFLETSCSLKDSPSPKISDPRRPASFWARSSISTAVYSCLTRLSRKIRTFACPTRLSRIFLALFQRYSWNLNDTPGGDDNEINPDVLGYIFEKYINQKAFGAYYTRTEITEYLCGRTIHRLILNAIKRQKRRRPIRSRASKSGIIKLSPTC